jgi:phosphorylcholine metabolism protein LicD
MSYFITNFFKILQIKIIFWYTCLYDYFYPTKCKCFANVWSNKKDKDTLYSLLKDVKYCLQKADVQYYAVFGTLLGCMRHKDVMDWDDDCDIAYMESDLKKLDLAIKLMKDKNIECITVREGLVKGKYLRVFYKDCEKLPWMQGKWPYCDLFESRDDLVNKTTFVFPSAQKPFKTESLYPLKLRKFGSVMLHTPKDPFAHLEAEFGSRDKPNNFMNTAVGTSFLHKLQLPSRCNTLQYNLKDL